jgi:hypothetical protein
MMRCPIPAVYIYKINYLGLHTVKRVLSDGGQRRVVHLDMQGSMVHQARDPRHMRFEGSVRLRVVAPVLHL